MKIAYSEYELTGVVPIEGKNVHLTRKGALLRLDFKSDYCGYADCHPWTELGDAPLQDQLRLLKQGKITPLLSRSIAFASEDACARNKKVSLFEGLTVPDSHFFISNILQWDSNHIEDALKEGFCYFKIKLGRNLAQELPKLIELLQISQKFKVRLDFNLKLTESEYQAFCEKIAPWKGRIDFFEDPFIFEKDAWERFQNNGYNLACDLNSEQALANPQSASVVVLKPAVQDDSPFLNNLRPSQKLVITSYLDHPIGQLAAAYTAAKARAKVPAQVSVCGLLSHRAYKPNPFSEQLAQQGPEFVIPAGTGCGLDDLLKKQRWIDL